LYIQFNTIKLKYQVLFERSDFLHLKIRTSDIGGYTLIDPTLVTVALAVAKPELLLLPLNASMALALMVVSTASVKNFSLKRGSVRVEMAYSGSSCIPTKQTAMAYDFCPEPDLEKTLDSSQSRTSVKP